MYYDISTILLLTCFLRFATPSGITTVPGIETPGSAIEIRKKKAADERYFASRNSSNVCLYS